MPRATPRPDKAVESRPVSSVERAALRSARIAAREALPVSEHRRLSTAIEAHLCGLLESRPPRRLGFCWPIRGEFDCRPLVSRLIARGMQAGLPRVVTPDTALTYCAWQPDSELLIDQYGIHYPADCRSLMPDVLLIPVNAFDAAGYRLGYGGGYFDRTLAKMAAQRMPPVTIGVGFELARVASIFPAPHDIPVDAVVTEAGVEMISARLRDGDPWPGARSGEVRP